MGDFNVKKAGTTDENQRFVRHLLEDVDALEYMLENNWFEDDIIRIGAEQEMCLIDTNYKPAHRNMELLESINDEDVVTELAKFNIELNLAPQVFEKNCFSLVEKEILEKMKLVSDHAERLDMKPILTGILPTIRKSDVSDENVTPLERYRYLMAILKEALGGMVELKLNGIDELIVEHESALLEACNTSFQVHLQIRPDEFVQKYNIAQAIAAPTMALAVNSPMLFGKRLWHETRIALFQQSLDTRQKVEHLREVSPRVTFGNDWLRKSILELYKEDITRFRVLLNTKIEEDVHEQIEKGITPKLRALNIHNGTVYRWNRPCYGISGNGKPHLRIENRILPAGPSILDEMANAALWIGLMNSFDKVEKDVTKSMDFDDARNNFFVACRMGLDSYMNWFGGRRISTPELLKKELIPLAKEGLKDANIDQSDIDRYIGVIEDRVATGVTGAMWIINSYSKLAKDGPKEEAITSVTAAIINNQEKNLPVAQWKEATFKDVSVWEPQKLLIEEFMTTDLFTVRENDVLELVADMMDWKKIRYVLVEDKKGKLVGLLSSRMLLRYFKKESQLRDKKPVPAKALMHPNPITVSPYHSIMDAMDLMGENKVGCLPVVKKGKLVGVVTEHDFMGLSLRLLKRLAGE